MENVLDARIDAGPVKRYDPQFRDLIIAGRGQRSPLGSHELGLGHAVDAYETFHQRLDGWIEVLPRPAR